MRRRIIIVLLSVCFVSTLSIGAMVLIISSNLPKLVTVEDYAPFVVSEVFDVEGRKIGEFFREKRFIVPYDQIPEKLVQAFLAAEDDNFFEHNGIDYIAIFRAFIANIKAGRKVQGGSTITQQVARSLLLTPEKTYKRKIREVLLSYRMEGNLSKEEILYLYLNQIYLGHGAYGVEAAARTYFKKSVGDLTLSEMAMLAGLPQAPSRYSPIRNPNLAKNRQRYVLNRMADVGYVTPEEAEKTINEPVKVFRRVNYKQIAPYFLETVRQHLVKTLGAELVLDRGIKVYTTLNLEKQEAAQVHLKSGLKELDKRQGYRGPLNHLNEPEELNKFLLDSRNELIVEARDDITVFADGTVEEPGPLNLEKKEGDSNLPNYVAINDEVKGVVTAVDDKWGLVYVSFAESKGLIDFDTMKWARKPNSDVRSRYAEISKPSEALAIGDVILVKLVSEKFSSSRIDDELRKLKRSTKGEFERPADLPILEEYVNLELEQDPKVEGALVSLDLNNEHILAMVGGYDFARSEFNRAIQATRQTGSSFKPIVYGAALDSGYTPATTVIDSPIVYETEDPNLTDEEKGMDATFIKKWKPGNYGSRFGGDILFRTALIKSKNVPTVKIFENVGIDKVATYARRLGIFSPLNMDLSMGLGSSSVTLYEMTKVFSIFGRMGKNIKPLMILSVVDEEGETLIENVTLDQRFEEEIRALEEDFEKRRLAALGQDSGKTPAGVDPASVQPADPQKMAENAQNEEDRLRELKLWEASLKYPLFFEDPLQLIKPQTSYLLTTLLKGVINEGTGVRARSLGRPVAGKTGTTNGYYDAWFIGFTPQISTGVWVGFDDEKSLGIGETGGSAALPVWLEYMKDAHKGMAVRDFPIPEDIIFSNIDSETGKLASTRSKKVVRQAFLDGTEPEESASKASSSEVKDFFRQDLAE